MVQSGDYEVVVEEQNGIMGITQTMCEQDILNH
jgi:hypothetical protein